MWQTFTFTRLKQYISTHHGKMRESVKDKVRTGTCFQLIIYQYSFQAYFQFAGDECAVSFFLLVPGYSVR
jgi:hypothetical protein